MTKQTVDAGGRKAWLRSREEDRKVRLSQALAEAPAAPPVEEGEAPVAPAEASPSVESPTPVEAPAPVEAPPAEAHESQEVREATERQDTPPPPPRSDPSEGGQG